MKKSIRIIVWNKFGKHCAYCGNPITYKQMQVDHFFPKRLAWWFTNAEKRLKYALPDHVDHIDNLMPSCRRCNHYKRSELPESFRITMKTLLKRVAAIYIVKVAIDFGMIQFQEWDGVFYFEKCIKRTK